MKKILIFSLMACVITACQTMDSVKSGFSSSYTQVSNLFKSPKSAPCPSFMISDELDSYYDISGADQSAKNAGLSSAMIEDIEGQCRFNDNEDIVTVSMDIDFMANAGKGNTSATQLNKKKLDIPYFIAVLDKDQEILAKDTFTIPLELSGAEMNTYHKERLQQNIPYVQGKDPSQYTIITGFQLSGSELAFAKTQERMAKIQPASGDSYIEPPAVDNVVGADPFAAQ